VGWPAWNPVWICWSRLVPAKLIFGFALMRQFWQCRDPD